MYSLCKGIKHTGSCLRKHITSVNLHLNIPHKKRNKNTFIAQWTSDTTRKNLECKQLEGMWAWTEKKTNTQLSTVDPYLLLRPGECQHTPPSPHTSELAIVSSTGGIDKIVPHGNILGSDIPAWSLPRDDESFWHLTITSSVLIFAQKQFNCWLNQGKFKYVCVKSCILLVGTSGLQTKGYKLLPITLL